MKNIPLSLAISFIFFFLMFRPLQADLQDLKQGVEQEEKENKAKEKPATSKSTSSTNEGCMGSCFSSCLDLTWNITGKLWIYHNLSVSYLSYPYEKEQARNFVAYGNPEQPAPEEANRKKHFYSLRLGYNASENEGQGGFMAFRGRFSPFFGPEAEARALWDKNDFLGYYAMGLNMALIQADYFSWDLYVQAALLRGVLNRTGAAFGTYFFSFPFRPITLMLRFSLEHFSYIDFFDFESKLGVMINRYELFFSYRFQESRRTFLAHFLSGITLYF